MARSPKRKVEFFSTDPNENARQKRDYPWPSTARIPFHDHLDACTQCRENPFALCTTGAALLKESACRI